MKDAPQKTARWQFSIRSMLAVTTLVAMFLAGIRAEAPLLILAALALGLPWISVVAWRRGGRRIDNFVLASARSGALLGGLFLFVTALAVHLGPHPDGIGGPEPPRPVVVVLLSLVIGGGIGALFGMQAGAAVGMLFGTVAAGLEVTWKMVESLRSRGSCGRDSRDNEGGARSRLPPRTLEQNGQ